MFIIPLLVYFEVPFKSLLKSRHRVCSYSYHRPVGLKKYFLKTIVGQVHDVKNENRFQGYFSR